MKWDVLEKIIEEIAPLYLQESWDHSGLQLLWEDREIRRVLICLEITDAVVSEAIYGDIDLIITHHPLLFGSLSEIDYRKGKGSYIAKLAAKKIAVYSSHTPFDKTEGGNNDYLAQLLGLEDVNGFIDGEREEPIGRVGRLREEMPLDVFVERVSQQLELEHGKLRFTGNPDAPVQVVGVCTGAGADLAELAMANECDVLITGDLKYHQAQDAGERGFAVIDAGHYGTERYFTENFAEKLYQKTLGQIEIFQSEINLDPFSVY